MRKLILIIALTAVPLGIWTAGCRNEQQAAFPNTPEMESLAGPSEKSDGAVSEVAAAPMIPEKPIDRDILHYPDNGTLARVRAANDRASLYAAEKAGRGLFALSEKDNYIASSAAPSANTTIIPAPSAREFWSKPMAERAREKNPARSTPEDVSAMAGPSRREGAAVTPPAPPARAPARSAREAFILPPEDMPGVFMVDELADDADGPADAPPSARRGWFGMLRKRDGGDALGAPPASSRPALSSAAGARPRAEITRRGPMVLDIDNLVGMDAAAPASNAFPVSEPARIAPGARIVSSEGMDFEPLPEPIPLSRYNSMVMEELAAPPAKRSSIGMAPALPLPAALVRGTGGSASAPNAETRKPVAAPAIPELTETGTAVKIPGAARFAKVEKALEPLPDISALAPTPSPAPVKASMKAKVVVMPEPMPEPLPTPEAAAAKAALLEFSPEAMDEAFAELRAESAGSDFFKTDFWEPAAKVRPVEPAAPPSLPVLPELSEPAAGLGIPMPPPPLSEPKKITLQPVRKVRAIPELEEIDSAMEAPPLKF